MTHYTGLLLDWVGNPDSTDETNTSSSSPVFKILPRLLIIFLALSSLVVSAIFETFGVIEKLIKLMADSSPIIANLLINIMFNACFNVLHLVIINRNIVKLLAQFHFLESRLLIINYNTKRRYDRIVNLPMKCYLAETVPKSFGSGSILTVGKYFRRIPNLNLTQSFILNTKQLCIVSLSTDFDAKIKQNLLLINI